MKNLKAGIFATIFLFAFAGVTSGASINGHLQIQAIVPSIVDFKIVHENHDLNITPSDAKKGYKKLNNWTIISVKTNDSNGYVISVSAQPLSINEVNVYTYLHVIVDGRSFGTAPGGSVDIQMPATSIIEGNIIRLDYRFDLGQNVVPGSYSWPIVVSISLL